MGLSLFARDGDVESPEASWSYSGFNDFRQRLAAADGFALNEMYGFRGDRQWSTVQSVLSPMLHHDDDRGELSAVDCGVMLPRLIQIIDGWAADNPDRALSGHIRSARNLVTVMQLCVERDVPLTFG